MKVTRRRLQANYDSFEEFERYSDMYGLAVRLGYDSAQEAWDENPLIQFSVNPNDFKKVDKRKLKG